MDVKGLIIAIVGKLERDGGDGGDGGDDSDGSDGGDGNGGVVIDLG